MQYLIQKRDNNVRIQEIRSYTEASKSSRLGNYNIDGNKTIYHVNDYQLK